MLMEMINTPEISKEKHLNSHPLVPVKHSAVKSAPNLYGLLKQYRRRKTRK